MAIGPAISLNVRGIEFPNVTTDSSPIYTYGILAASTGGIVYQSGTMLAQYTAGADTGKFVNYDSVAGTNGQNVFVGIIDDDQIVNGTSVTGQVKIIIWNTKGAIIQSALKYTQIADIAAAIAQRDAKVLYDAFIPGQYLIYGM